MIVIFADGVKLTKVSHWVKANFLWLRNAVMQNGLALIHTFFKEAGSANDWSFSQWKRNSLYLEGSNLVIYFGWFCYIKLVLLRTNTRKYAGRIFNLRVNLFFEEVRRGNINLWRSFFLTLLVRLVKQYIHFLNGFFYILLVDNKL